MGREREWGGKGAVPDLCLGAISAIDLDGKSTWQSPIHVYSIDTQQNTQDDLPP